MQTNKDENEESREPKRLKLLQGPVNFRPVYFGTHPEVIHTFNKPFHEGILIAFQFNLLFF